MSKRIRVEKIIPTSMALCEGQRKSGEGMSLPGRRFTFSSFEGKVEGMEYTSEDEKGFSIYIYPEGKGSDKEALAVFIPREIMEKALFGPFPRPEYCPYCDYAEKSIDQSLNKKFKGKVVRFPGRKK